MRRKVGIIKRIFSLLLVFLFSINSFAAVVSDNDGSAFITKAEFDSLKNSFQSQIATYNMSIDSKIDGAIAAYLAGIRTALPWNIKQRQMKFLNTWQYKTPLSDYILDFTTISVTNGVSSTGAPAGAIDFTYPEEGKFLWFNDVYNPGMYVGNMTRKDESDTTAGNVILQLKFKSFFGNWSDYAGYFQTAWSNLPNYSATSAQVETWLTNNVGIPKDIYDSVEITLWMTNSTSNKRTYATANKYTVTGTLPKSINSARQTTQKQQNLTPSAATCTAVQVMNDGGKLIIDTKPYLELKIKNVCTVDCFNYQDHSSSTWHTNPSAFNDSSYNGVTVTLPEQWSWNTMMTSGTAVDAGSSIASKNNYITVQNFIGFAKASTQVLKNTTWGKPSYTTNVVTVDDGLTLNKNGASTQYYDISQGTFTGTSKYLASSTATSVSTGTSTIYYPALKIPKYTYKQYSQQIYDYYSNDFTDAAGNLLKWGEGVLIADCQAERDSSRVMIKYHIENMSGTATTGSACTFELSTKKFVKCVAESGTSMGTQTVTPSSTTTNTVTFDIGTTDANAELWLNAYCNTSNYTVVIDDIVEE